SVLLLLSFLCITRPPPTSTLFPYTTLFRSCRSRPHSECRALSKLRRSRARRLACRFCSRPWRSPCCRSRMDRRGPRQHDGRRDRSEEHTSELQSRENLVCRLLLEKKKTKKR